MAKVLIVYYSRSGNTEKMAQLIAQGITKAGVSVEFKKVTEAKPDDLLSADGIILGSPTYYGAMAAEIKSFLDLSVKHHGSLAGKVGGAFASAANYGGGVETTVLSMLQALLIHGLIIQGDPEGAHYGACALSAPDKKRIDECLRYGERFAQLVKKIHP